MIGQDVERWNQLCTEVTTEKDPIKWRALVEEMSDLVRITNPLDDQPSDIDDLSS